MTRASESMQPKVVSHQGFAKKRVGTIACCGLLFCVLVGPNRVFVGSALSESRGAPHRHVGVAMYERAPHGVGENVVLLGSDKSWHRAVVTNVKSDGTTIVKVEGSPSVKTEVEDGKTVLKVDENSAVKSTPKRRSNFALRKLASADPARVAIIEAIRDDLENHFTDGFVSTPFSPNVRSANPFMQSKGRLTFEILKNVSPLQFLNLYMAGDSATFKIKSIQQAEPDVNPFDGIASPPVGRIEKHWADATWAVHAEWEIQGKGRFQVGPLFAQRPFYLSGHDVFRINADGKVIAHEKGYNQDLRSILSYFDPHQHVLGLDMLYPVDPPRKPDQHII